MTKTIAFQGTFGAYSHLASKEIFSDAKFLPCANFSQAFDAVQSGIADFAVIPIENSNAGRVADVHFLLSNTPLYIIGEHFIPIHHQLLGLRNSSLENIKTAFSHPQALSQSNLFLQKNNITAIPQTDTAESCKIILEKQDPSIAAIASSAAADIYGLKILSSNIENAFNNTTRFLIMSSTLNIPKYDNNKKYITSLLFTTKNIPAALYKCLGGFVSNNLNITKLESYLLNGKFVSAQFYLEVEAHPEQEALKNAISELKFFSKNYTILGAYSAHDHRYL